MNIFIQILFSWHLIGLAVLFVTDLKVLDLAKNWAQKYFLAFLLGPVYVPIYFIIQMTVKLFVFLGRF